MIPAIGLIVTAYVVFRCIEAVMHVGPGGVHSNLRLGPQLAVGLLAVGVCIVVLFLAWQLIEAGANGSATLESLRSIGP